VRGRLAAIVALLALVALSTRWWHGTNSGGGAGATFSYAYTFDGWRSWAPLAFALIAAALLAAAALLWTARRVTGVVLGAAIAAAAIAAGVWAAQIGSQFASVSLADVSAARIGTPRALLERRLGAPLTRGATETPSTPVPALRCDVYRAAPGSSFRVALLCFRDGRLALKLDDTGGILR
jgi:hypothetical protein